MRAFPNKQRHNDLYLDELDNFNKKVVLKHLKISGQIQMWIKIRNSLLKQIREKKSKQKGNKFMSYTKLTKHYYKNYLFMKDFNNLSIFKCYMENSMIKEMSTDKMNYVPIYYGHEYKPEEFKYDKYEKNEWKLSSRKGMSNNDKQIMEKYKIGIIKFLRECIKIMQKNKIQEAKRCEKFYDKLRKKMNNEFNDEE